MIERVIVQSGLSREEYGRHHWPGGLRMVGHIFCVKCDRSGFARSNPEDIGLQPAEGHFVLLFDTHEAILGESNRDIGVFIRQTKKARPSVTKPLVCVVLPASTRDGDLRRPDSGVNTRRVRIGGGSEHDDQCSDCNRLHCSGPPFVGQADILGIDHIAETIRRSGVVNIDGPKPQRCLRVEGQ